MLIFFFGYCKRVVNCFIKNIAPKLIHKISIQSYIACGVACVLLGCTPAQNASDAFAWVTGEGGFPDVNALNVVGNIQVAGSSTVFPLAEALASRFNDEGYGYNLTIDSIGSGAGLERFCVAAESDISNASRLINVQEIESCSAIGRVPIEIRIGVDALAISVNVDNNWIHSASIEELAHIFTAEKWSDVVSTWPDEPIERFVPGTDSGTFDYFVEEIFKKDAEPILSTSNTQYSEDDNVLVRGIKSSRYAVGFFGFAYYYNDPNAIKILSINGVEANAANIGNGSYPLARPLIMYIDATIVQKRPQVGAFLSFVLNYVNEEIEEVGYFPVSDQELQYSKDTVLSILRDGGMQFGN